MSATFSTACRDDSLELNVANGNFDTLCAALGLEITAADFGTLEPLDLLDRVDRVLGILSRCDAAADEFCRSTIVRADGRVVEFGADADYLRRRLTVLARIAARALRLGVCVTYG